MTYIEREALPVTEIVERKRIFIDGRARTTNIYTKVVTLKDLEAAPAADVVKVVRCRECKYYSFDNGANWCRLHKGLAMVLPDAFCSYGVKRED